jgi:hypothetical protein
MNWTLIKSAITSLVKLAYSQGYITAKARDQILDLLAHAKATKYKRSK